jgi:uncharacterized protein (TIGR02284 family)
MAELNERWVLNRLIEMCRDEELALRHAAEHVKDPSVKKILTDIASQRAQFAADLVSPAQRLGGADAAEGTTIGALHRAWMALKDAVTGYSDSKMLAEAEHGEDLALATYEKVLDDMLLPISRDLIERQRAEVRVAHARVEACLSR